MLSWEEYLTAFINHYRDEFKRQFNDEEQSYIISNLYNQTFLAPCQIEVIDSKKPLRQGWIISFDKNRPDMEFTIYENIEDLESFFENRKKDPNWLKFFGEDMKKWFIKEFCAKKLPWESSTSSNDEEAFTIFNFDVKSRSPSEFALDAIDDNRLQVKFLERNKIEKTTQALKKDIKEIPESDIRSKLLGAANAIERSVAQIKRVDEHDRKLTAIEEEIGGVRKLIGVSKEFQDWRVLVSDVKGIKEDYTRKTELDREIKRLDQRIDDIGKIKFWSKRTIVDILLGIGLIITTLVVALFATDIF